MINPFDPMNIAAILLFSFLFGVGISFGLKLGDHIVKKG